MDLILGGHDHETMMQTRCGVAPFIKAASDLKTFWSASVVLNNDSSISTIDSTVHQLTAADSSDPPIAHAVAVWEGKLSAALGTVIGCTHVVLEGRTKFVRQQETNLGNWICDALREEYSVDVALFNGGGIRGNRQYSAGEMTKLTITTIHPFGNKMAAVRANKTLLEAHIRTSLACYDTLCGDFLQVSGIAYSFDRSTQQLLSLTYQNGSAIGSETFTVVMSDFMLLNSVFKDEPLYGLTSLTDAVPLLQTLERAVEAMQPACIAPVVDGRINMVS